MISGTLSVDHFQTQEYGEEHIFIELVTADSIHKILNVAIEEYILTLI